MSRRSRARISASSCVGGTRCPRCSSSSSRPSWCSTSRFPTARAMTPPMGCSGWRSSSRRSSDLREHGCPSRSTAFSTDLFSRRATAARSGSARRSRRSRSCWLPRQLRFRRSCSSSSRSARLPSPVSCSLTSGSVPSGRCCRRWRRPPAHAKCCSRSSCCRLRSRSIVGGVGAAISPDGERFLLFLLLYDGVFAVLSWASFEYVVTE